MREVFRTPSWLVAIVLLTIGCAQQPADQVDGKTNQAESSAASQDHAHGSGPHGGAIADWGGGKYHVEFTVDHDQRQAAVYVLAADATTPVAIRAEKLLLSILGPRFQVDLGAAPLEGEPENASSRFVGKHDSLGIVQEFAGTISGQVDGTPYAGDFVEVAAGD